MEVTGLRPSSCLSALTKELSHGPSHRHVVILMCGAVLFGAGIYAQRAGFVGQVGDWLRRTGTRPVRRLVASYPADPPRIMIDIKHKHVQKLADQRQVALERESLVATADDYVPAKIRHEDSVVAVKLRLKGDHSDHLEGEKWPSGFVSKVITPFWV